MSRTYDLLIRIRKKIGLTLALLALSLYIIMLFTYLVFLTTMLLLGLLIVVPLMILAFIRKDRKFILRRFKASCWMLGVLILILFPSFWLIPQQIYVRANRQTTLITPDVSVVDDFADEFFSHYLFSGWNSKNFTEKAKSVSRFISLKIDWKMDYETYGMSGHVATPAEVLARREDDCQGEAVTMASLLLNSKFNNTFPYVWVVETPWHWYVLIRDPAKGPLSPGWEKYVEVYQKNGELFPLNRDGTGNCDSCKGMPEYRWEPIQLIFNAEETLFPVNFFEAIWIGWSSTGFFQHEIFENFAEDYLLFIIIAAFILAIPMTGWLTYMTKREGERKERKKYRSLKILIPKVFLIGLLIILIFIEWYFTQELLWDYTLIIAISQLSTISCLASEHKFWKLLRIEK